MASDLGSRRELVHEGATGVLFPAGDVAQLAGAISFLVERPQLAAEMGAAGRTLVTNQYSAEIHYAATDKAVPAAGARVKESGWPRHQIGGEAGVANRIHRRTRRGFEIQRN